MLATVIHSDESGYIPNRYSGETIRLIQDMMEYTKVKAIPGILVLSDFEKAFDSIEWKFLEMTLQKFNFGENVSANGSEFYILI